MTNLNIKIEGVDFKNEAALADYAKTLAGKSEATIKANVAGLAFALGRFDRDNGANKPRSFKPMFQAWAGVHYVGDRKTPKQSTQDAMISAFNAYGELGALKTYDGLPVADFVNSQKMAYTDLGATVRRIIAKYPEKLPTEVEMLAECPVKKAKTARSTAEGIRDDMIGGFGEKGKWLASLVTPEQRLAAADAIALFQWIAKTLPEDVTEEETNYREVSAKLKAEIKAAKEAAKK